MEYKIVSANADIGQIQVVFSEDGVTLASYAIDVPIVAGAYLTGDALEAEILTRAPTWLVNRKSLAQSASGFENILARIEPTPEVSVTVDEVVDIVPNIQVV
jgi:hypothetical protein